VDKQRRHNAYHSRKLESGKAENRHPEATYEEKERLFLEVKNDVRYKDFIYGCYECGICVSACPSARFYDFSPRVIAQAIAREDVERIYDIITEDIWNCAQCFSCVRCPRQNNPGAWSPFCAKSPSKTDYKNRKMRCRLQPRDLQGHAQGNQVSPICSSPISSPIGAVVQNFSQNMHVWRKAIPMDSIRGLTDVAWRTDRKTLLELYTIWFESGNMDIIKELDESLYDLLTEVMQEELEEG